MNIGPDNYHTIWVHPENNKVIQVIDQRKLPFLFELYDLRNSDDAFFAIREMVVRGAPLIGVTGAYGIYLALLECDDHHWSGELLKKADFLKSARPTAVNLSILIDEITGKTIHCHSKTEAVALAFAEAEKLKHREIEWSEAIGDFGCRLIEEISRRKAGQPVNILTHCNAGWLACIDWGTATAPIYKAFRKGIPVHVWIDETRPRNQGARLTAWEMDHEGVPHTVIPDNAGGHLMQHGQVDLCLVGSDRTTASGDVANKIGTYLKALAANDNGIPFYVALPSSTIDFTMHDGLREIPIEQRAAEEVRWMEGVTPEGRYDRIQVIPDLHAVANYGFDVTPARLITALITERGICPANPDGIAALFPDRVVAENRANESSQF